METWLAKDCTISGSSARAAVTNDIRDHLQQTQTITSMLIASYSYDPYGNLARTGPGRVPLVFTGRPEVK